MLDVMHQSKATVPLLVAKCVPGRSPGPLSKTQSFVLPFKIADKTSLGKYSEVLRQLNPSFLPSYKKNELCNDFLHADMTDDEEEELEKKRKLENIDEHLVSNIRKKRRLI
jgi:hypothetical protein